jgi:uncharacterized membrane protein YphA (DoxX/SURF4 family)
MHDPTLRLVLLLAGAVLLVGISVRWTRGPTDTLGAWPKFFLVALRLVIGWHFLIEGLDKLASPTWSSEAYLREASGPLAPHFRELAGDRLADMLTVSADKSFPAELDIEWQAYLDAFAKHYQLNEEQTRQAQGVVDQAKADAVSQLTSATKLVQKPGPYPPTLMVEMTMPERLEHYERLKAEVAKTEADLPRFGEESWEEYKSAKADLNRWRADLKRDLEVENLKMRKALRDQVLAAIMLETAPPEYRKRLAPPKAPKEPAKDDPLKRERDWLHSVGAVYGEIRLKQMSDESVKLPSQLETIFGSAFDPHKDDSNLDDPLPETPRRPIEAWTLLDWSDALVKYGLIAVGGCLLVGFLTRTACLVGALFLLSFYLAMPPLPWLPEGPRQEGHYLYVNKNIIEMVALLALATLRTGRWAGVDGILQFLRPSRWRKAPASANVK